MSVEKLNQKLEKILKELDSAIEDRDLGKATKAVKNVQDLNQKSEGKINDILLNQLETKMREITKEINEDDELSINEIKGLANIREEIKAGKEPFEQIKAVVEALEQKGVSQKDLKNYKEAQKKDNLFQIEGLKKNSEELAVRISDIEMRYMDKVNHNDECMKIMEDLAKEKNLLLTLDPTTDTERIDSVKSDIKNKISDLASKGINVNAIQNFESNPNVIDIFCIKEIKTLNDESNAIASQIGTDQAIPDSFKNLFDLGSVQDAKDLKDKYKEMTGKRQKNAFKIVTLEAENRQIDHTIKTLEKEEQAIGIVYHEDGTEKSEQEIIKEMYKHDKVKEKIERQVNENVNEKFDGGFFKRYKARMNYYKETQQVGTFKAFFKALVSKTEDIKQIEASAQASEIALVEGRKLANVAATDIERRQNRFKETIRTQATKKMVKNPSLTANDIRDDIMEEAYKTASDEQETNR